MLVIKYKNIFFGITAALILGSVALIAAFGLNYGTDFTGGTLIEVTYEGERPSIEALSSSLSAAGLEGFTVRGTGDDGYIIRAPSLAAETRATLPSAVSVDGASSTISRLTDIGPTVGTELRNKAFIAIGLVIAAIMLFIAFAFRKVSKPISSWIYGLITIVTLTHDVIIPVGAFALFGYLWGAQVDTLFVTAILTVLGYSVHDTIVVFDRVRENLRINQESGKKEDFELVAGRAIDQTFARSINTSVTTLIALAALFFLGPAATQDFALTLIVGIAAGTYSSITLAVPLLAAIANRQKK